MVSGPGWFETGSLERMSLYIKPEKIPMGVRAARGLALASAHIIISHDIDFGKRLAVFLNVDVEAVYFHTFITSSKLWNLCCSKRFCSRFLSTLPKALSNLCPESDLSLFESLVGWGLAAWQILVREKQRQQSASKSKGEEGRLGIL